MFRGGLVLPMIWERNRSPMSTKGILLIVDDQAPFLQWLQVLFVRHGYEVATADGGTPALAAVRDAKPDLILLDVMMPDLDGYETCRRLKALPETRDIPVIFLSALDSSEEKVKGFQAGAVDFIQKPFAEEEALLRVQTHLELAGLRRSLEDQVWERTRELEAEIEARAQVERELRDSLARNHTLMRELQHRVKNTLGMASSLLQLARPAHASEESVELIRRAQARIQSLVGVYSLLYHTDSLTTIDFAQYARKLVDSWRDIYYQSAEGIELNCRAIPVRFPADTLILLGLIITELLTNALKYAFPDGRRGRIDVDLMRQGAGYRLTVRDNGQGFDLQGRTVRGMGLELVSALTGQLNGNWTLSQADGTRGELWFPEPPRSAEEEGV
jgi:two-component sensor histidine kinase/AmiR/NasT family two-component response regulator